MKAEKPSLSGVYLERDVYRFNEITKAQMDALEALGVEIVVDGDAKIVKILRDTSEVDHERCGEPLDSLDMIG